MKGKSALFALAVVVLMGTMGGVALADHQETNGMYGPDDFSVAAQPEGVGQSDPGEIRGPVETGAVPDRSEGLDAMQANGIGDSPIGETGGQPYSPDVDPGT